MIIVLTLFAGNGFDALLMATSCKFCVEEFVEALAAYVFADETTGEDDDVGVVVLTDEVGNLWLSNKSGTDALVLVEGHAYSLATATDSNSDFHVSAIYCLTQFMSIVWIITTLFVKTAVVLVGVSFFLKIAPYKHFKCIASMV